MEQCTDCGLWTIERDMNDAHIKDTLDCDTVRVCHTCYAAKDKYDSRVLFSIPIRETDVRAMYN